LTSGDKKLTQPHYMPFKNYLCDNIVRLHGVIVGLHLAKCYVPLSVN